MYICSPVPRPHLGSGDGTSIYGTCLYWKEQDSKLVLPIHLDTNKPLIVLAKVYMAGKFNGSKFTNSFHLSKLEVFVPDAMHVLVHHLFINHTIPWISVPSSTITAEDYISCMRPKTTSLGIASIPHRNTFWLIILDQSILEQLHATFARFSLLSYW